MGIVFDESLFTGNELIDTQHQELISRINRLSDVTLGKEKTAAIQTLDFLMDYVEIHFSAEEKLQAEAGYPDIEAHKALHRHFENSVSELKEMLEEEEGPSEAFVAAVKKNVADWFVNHIEVCDKKVASYIRSQS